MITDYKLTKKEQQIAGFLAQGKSKEQITEIFKTKHTTTVSIVANMRKKTNSFSDRMLILKCKGQLK